MRFEQERKKDTRIEFISLTDKTTKGGTTTSGVVVVTEEQERFENLYTRTGDRETTVCSVTPSDEGPGLLLHLHRPVVTLQRFRPDTLLQKTFHGVVTE